MTSEAIAGFTVSGRGGGGWRSCAVATATWLSPSNGRQPARHS